MAAEIPVKAALCEANEYLSKLGSNLHTRSENLKEKRIRKDKLTNSLAVQKAACKLLLICELSKKSLAIVEAGVRKVLEHSDVSQASSKYGGKSSRSKYDSEKKDDNPKYHYFDYKSRKLKIKNKISLKHYKSVKVVAKKMPLSILEKYPVYHDCKLYRMRGRKKHSNKPESPNEEELECSKVQETTENDKLIISKEQAPSDKIEKYNSDTETLQSNCNRRQFDEKTHSKSGKKKKYRAISSESDDVEDTKQSDEKKDSNDDICSNNEQKDSEQNIGMNTDDEKHLEGTKHNKQKEKDVDSNSTDEKPQKNTKKNNEKVKRDNDYISDSEQPQKDTSDDDSRTDNEKRASSKNVDKESKKSSEEPEPKKIKLSKAESKQQNENNSVIVLIDSDAENNPARSTINLDTTDDVSSKTAENKSDSENETDSTKPIIKCVSLSKLLKPAVLQKNPVEASAPKKGIRLEFNTNKKNEMLLTAKKNKEMFWAQKRKEVCEFKPKDFDINITRLPELSTDFLRQNKLNKITKDGKIVYEILKDKSDSTLKAVHSSINTHANDDNAQIKASLLMESDSDGNGMDSEIPALPNSDSDSSNRTKKKAPHITEIQEKEGSVNNNERLSATSDKQQTSDKSNEAKDDNSKTEINDSHQSDSDTEKVKSDKSNKAKDDKNNSDDLLLREHKTPERVLTADNVNVAKNFLLADSDDETKIPLDQKKAASPQSKQKRMREIAKAKFELLRPSSGSETEDEQLSNVLNDIKKTLLETISDDENFIKEKNLKNSQESSSSDEDILKKVKKKKKCNRRSNDSDSSVPRKKITKRKKRKIKSDSEEEKKNSSNDEDKSASSSSKMVRSKAKPGNSSSHSSEDIDGLANLRTLNNSRRRISDSDKESSSNSAPTRTRMSGKPTGLISEQILKAESSSDAASTAEDEAADEDLPSVTLPGFNGGLEHLVKEGLLGESDSSVSNKEEVKTDSDEEERLNAKRRKANAIASSDSETGTARRKIKDDDVRLSDFEDSDDSDVTKKTKRKKKGSDSDASAGSNDTGKKKRRRIKSVNDSDASGSDSENEGKNKHGRKNIRKVMGKNQLEEATKKAAREEKERVARIAERQKMYNNLQFDESGKPDEVVLEKVVLDFDPETKEPLIAVDRGLVKKLKPHQANGIKFMWDACFESVKRIKKDKGSGCILAHCMGLGKTLQVVALTHTLLAHDSLTKVHRVLVVCPLSTVLNWVNEFKMWLKHAERENEIDVYELSRFKQNGERAFQLSQWFEHGGVCVLGYEMFRNLSADNNKKFKKKMLKNFQEALVDPGPDLVVCDEGHLLKNEKTSLSQSMNKVRTLRRIVLTGTPLQNNLKEYYCMVQFVKPNLLGKYNEYLNRFVNPITNGQYTDSTEHDIKIMKRRSHVLHKMLDGAVQRRDYGVLAPFLPPKHEYVLFITLTEVQTKLYQHYLDNYSRRPLPGKSSGFLFPDFQSLQRIWTHPLVLKYNSERYEIMQQKKRDKEEEDSEGSLVDFIDDDSTPAESTSDDSTDDSSEMSDDSRKKSKKKKSSKKAKGKDKDKDKDKDSAVGGSRRRGTRANPIDLDLDDDKDDDIMEVKNENPTEWWIKLVEEDVLDDLRNSHKLVLLFDILRQCETIGDKLLVFSQSLYSLDLIEHFLGKVDEATQDGRIDEKLGNHVGSWSPGIDYFRLDGSTSCENRSIWCKNFNREDNPRARLFLISTRAGGLGINLVAANRVVIFDVSWNPSHDVQSIFRVYRFGQKKPCYVYRFLAMGTMEEKIYERQVTKQAISKRVIDEQQIDRHYAENDLAELYKFEAEPPSPRPIPPLPKDRLFAEMLREHEAQIYKYHEHDSLLENKEEETLSEEERKAAWEDFENEKNRPPPAPFPSPWPMANGMMPNLLAQQQQQLAYAALAAMLRKDMPNVNDNQIRDMLPMIYNANPALMQKMSDIYKYSQQMNMTPGMMGQGGMNSASSGGMPGMGGASGLQYEPPWQRQQQQQQQMRLQQLMAQQQNMGAAAKFYAGGLGSRDPVAMALQQQRAREIMVGGGAGRPRGRPPLQPRGPPAPTADVVNLDSD